MDVTPSEHGPNQVRQRKGCFKDTKSDGAAAPAVEKVSGRSFWLVACLTSCCAIWCLLFAVAAVMFISVPPELSAFQYYSDLHIKYGHHVYEQEVLDGVDRIPFPGVSDPLVNEIQHPSGDDYFRMFSQGPRKGGTRCEDLHGVQREFCLISVGDGAVTNYNKYVGLREKCEWKTEDAFEAYPNFLYLNMSDSDMKRESAYSHFSYKETQRRIDQHRHRGKSTRIRIKTCNVREDNHWEWSVNRIGPFYSNGGYDWHRYLIPNTTARGHTLYSGFFYAPVQEDGKAIGYPPLHIHHMHSATTQCILVDRLWRGGVPDPNLKKFTSRQWYFDIHGDRQCMEDRGGMACLHKELPEGYANYILLPQCVFGEVNDVRPPNSPTMEFWLEHAYRYTKHHEIARPTGFYTGGPGNHIHVEEGVSVANAVMGALKPETEYKPTLYPVDDYDVPSNEDSVIWCSLEIPFDLEFLSVWVHTHHQYTYDMLWFRSHPRNLGLDSEPVVLENHYTPLVLSKTGLTRQQLKTYLYNNMHRNGGELACKLNEDRFENGEPGVLPKGLKNNRYDRLAMPNCSSNLRFAKGEIITMVALHGSVFDKVTKSNRSIMHSGWNAQFIRPECDKLVDCAKQRKVVDDLHISCLEFGASPREVAIELAEQHLQNTRDNVQKIREQLAAFSMQGGGTW